MSDYIKRDDVIKIANGLILKARTIWQGDEVLLDMGVTFRDMVEALPAADVEERKRARNEDGDYEVLFKCSNCGWKSLCMYDNEEFKYCPGCGAELEDT